jgi:hypothetical protein
LPRQRSDLSPKLSAAKTTSSGFGLPSKRRNAFAIIMRALIAASFTDGDNDGASSNHRKDLRAEFRIADRLLHVLDPEPSSSATIARV